MLDGWHLHSNAVSFNDVGRFNGECNINGTPVSSVPARAGNGEILHSHGFISFISIIAGYRIFVKLKDCKDKKDFEFEMSILLLLLLLLCVYILCECKMEHRIS